MSEAENLRKITSPTLASVVIGRKISQKKESLYLNGGSDYLANEQVENEATRGEIALWRAVITQALMDAGSNSAKKEMRLEKAQAVAWLSGRSPDFHTVCSLASLDPNYVRQKAQEAIKRGCIWRDDCAVNPSIKKIKAEKKTKKQSPIIVNDNKPIEAKSFFNNIYAIGQN